MRQTTRPTLILIFTISVSLFGLFTSLMLALYPPIIEESFLWRKPLIGLIFAFICVSGIFAAIFPRRCLWEFHFRKQERSSATDDAPSMALKGHHPDCGKFTAHVIHISEHRLCAACTGLSLGAFIVLVGTAFYFFGGWRVDEMSFPAVLIGIVGVALGFLQLKFRGFIRLSLNTLFVLGAFLILVGIDALVKRLFIDMFLIALIVFWLMTRIILSQWDHSRTCQNCESKCEIPIQRNEG